MSLSKNITIPGLSNGTSYDVQLKAIYGDGTIHISNALSAMPYTTSSAPTLVRIDQTSLQSLAVHFIAPNNNGGSTITNYKYSVDNGTTWVPAYPTTTVSPLNIVGLAAGVDLYVRIRAVNAAGDGTPTDSVVTPIQITPPTAASAPSIVSVVQLSTTSVAVNFLPPASSGGGTITNYKYSIDGGSTWTTRFPAAATAPLNITGLTVGASLSIKLQAVTEAGDGDASDAYSFSLTPPAVASAPTIVSIAQVVGTNNININFLAPSSSGDATITNYEYTLDGGSTWISRYPESTLSPIFVGNLTAGSTVEVKLRALTAAGTGNVSTQVSKTLSLPALPTAPTITNFEKASKSLKIYFTPPDTAGDAAIINYKYSLDDGVTWIARAPSSVVSPISLTGLTNNQQHIVRLRAVSSLGDGEATPTIDPIILGPAPGAPVITKVVLDDSVTFLVPTITKTDNSSNTPERGSYYGGYFTGSGTENQTVTVTNISTKYVNGGFPSETYTAEVINAGGATTVVFQISSDVRGILRQGSLLPGGILIFEYMYDAVDIRCQFTYRYPDTEMYFALGEQWSLYVEGENPGFLNSVSTGGAYQGLVDKTYTLTVTRGGARCSRITNPWISNSGITDPNTCAQITIYDGQTSSVVDTGAYSFNVGSLGITASANGANYFFLGDTITINGIAAKPFVDANIYLTTTTSGFPITKYYYSTDAGQSYNLVSPSKVVSSGVFKIEDLEIAQLINMKTKIETIANISTESTAYSFYTQTHPQQVTIGTVTLGATSATLPINISVTYSRSDVVTALEYVLETGTVTTISQDTITWTKVPLSSPYMNQGSYTYNLTISNLKIQDYTIFVRAANSQFSGTYSYYAVSLQAVPGAPEILSYAAVGAGQLSVNLRTLKNNRSITGWSVSRDAGQTFTSLSTTGTSQDTTYNYLATTISGLDTAKPTQLKFKATSSAGTSNASELLAATAVRVPAAPTIAWGVPSGGLRILITPPQDTGGSPITNYSYSVDDGITWTTRSPASTESPLIITDALTVPGIVKDYSIKVRAINSAGFGEVSNPLTESVGVPGIINVSAVRFVTKLFSVPYTFSISSGLIESVKDTCGGDPVMERLNVFGPDTAGKTFTSYRWYSSYIGLVIYVDAQAYSAWTDSTCSITNFEVCINGKWIIPSSAVDGGNICGDQFLPDFNLTPLYIELSSFITNYNSLVGNKGMYLDIQIRAITPCGKGATSDTHRIYMDPGYVEYSYATDKATRLSSDADTARDYLNQNVSIYDAIGNIGNASWLVDISQYSTEYYITCNPPTKFPQVSAVPKGYVAQRELAQAAYAAACVGADHIYKL